MRAVIKERLGGLAMLFIRPKIVSFLFLLIFFVALYAQGGEAAEQNDGTLTQRLRGTSATVRGENLQVDLLLRGICRQAGVNVIVDQAVTDTISLDLENADLYDVFHVIMDAKKLRFHEVNNALVVEKIDAAKEDQSDLVMVRMCASFGDVSQHLKELEVVKSASGSMTVSQDGNCMMVKDHAKNVEQIKALLAELDRPTPQVHIKARIVTMDKSLSKQLGIKWGYADLTRNPANTFTAATDLAVANPTTNILFGFIRDNWTLDTELSAMQERKELHMLSSPRVVVLNGQKAEIKQGKEVPYETTGTTDTASSTSFREALLSLTVTPKILQDNFLRLDVKVTNDSIDESHDVENGQPLLNRQEIQTNLFLENGVTVVIGGILARGSDLGNQEVPVLSEIPVVGNLFKNKDELERTYELLIFLTPTIIQGQDGNMSRQPAPAEGRVSSAASKIVTVPFGELEPGGQSGAIQERQGMAAPGAADPFSLEDRAMINGNDRQRINITPLQTK